MDDFGAKLVAFGKGIVDFSAAVDGKVSESAITAAVNAGKMISELASSLPNSGGVAGFFAGNNDMDDFAKQLKEFGKGIADFSESVSGKVSGVDSSILSIKKLIAILKDISSVNSGAIDVFKNSLKTLGKSSIDSFIKSFDGADARTKEVINKFLNATSNAINSRKELLNTLFKGVGKYLVDGFAKGITDNTFKAEAKAKAMALKALDAAKKALDEHSPSKKFAKVGAFAVEGFARGIIKNAGDANKASVKMANGVLKSTQDALGIHSPSIVFDKQVGRYIVQGIAEGITNDMSAEEAIEKKAQNIVNAFQDALDRIDRGISNRSKEFDLWSLTDGKYASNTAIAEKQMKKLNDDLWDQNQSVKLLSDKYELLKNTLGSNSKYAQEAYGAMLDGQITSAKTASELIAVQESLYDDEIQKIRDLADSRDRRNSWWEAKYGDDASDWERFSYYTKQDAQNVLEAKSEVKIAKEKYESFIKEYIKLNGVTIELAKQSDKAKELMAELENAQIAEEQAKQTQRNRRKSYYEQEKEDLKDQLSTVSDIADLKYQLWEKTTGRKATDYEKEIMKLSMLTEQMGSQAKLVRIAEQAWRTAKSDEKQKLEKEYLTAQLELANLQSEVLDIQEENIKRQERALDRQRNAQSEYADYIKKYEKYYLDHGMTREELEKDARLVSSYDPNKTVNNMISKTSIAMSKLKDNTQYNKLLSNFSDMGVSYASAVGDGIQNGVSTVTETTTKMLKTCVNILDDNKEGWTKAGITLVESFIAGIHSKTQDAALAAIKLATNTLTSLRNALDGDMDYSPTIRPVLDMSNVKSGASTLSSMLNSKTSYGLATSISRRSGGGSNNIYSKMLEAGQGPRNVYNFTQNNTSPKALSSSEIFRQTRNMFSTIKKKG